MGGIARIPGFWTSQIFGGVPVIPAPAAPAAVKVDGRMAEAAGTGMEGPAAAGRGVLTHPGAPVPPAAGPTAPAVSADDQDPWVEATVRTLMEATGVSQVQVTSLLRKEHSREVVGRIFVVGGAEPADIRALPGIFATLVPQWPASAQRGGGPRGGIAEWWVRRARDNSNQRLGDAVLEYERVRDAEPDGTVDRGRMVVARTGITDGTDPLYVVGGATVPGNDLKIAGGASQEERMRDVEYNVDRFLAKVGPLIAREYPGRDPKKDQILISLPALETGDDGAVSYEECAAAMLRRLEAFLRKNPGVNFVIPLNDSYRGRHTRDLEAFAAIMRVDEAAQAKMSQLKLPVPETPASIFDRLMNEGTTTAQAGVPFNRVVFYSGSAEQGSKGLYDQFARQFLSVLESQPEIDLEDEAAVRALFPTMVQQQFYRSIYRYLQVINPYDHADPLAVPRADRLQDIKRLLWDGKIDLIQQVYSVIFTRLRRDGVVRRISSEETIPQMIAAAAGTILSDARFEVLERMMESGELNQRKGEYDKQLREANERAERAQTEFEEARRGLEQQIEEAQSAGTVQADLVERLRGQLQSREGDMVAMQAELARLLTGQGDTEETAAELAEVRARETQAQRQIRRLREELERVQGLLQAQRQRAEDLHTAQRTHRNFERAYTPRATGG